MNKWVLEQIKPETLQEAKMTKQKLAYFEHIMKRQDSLEKIKMLREIEDSRKSGRPDMIWNDSVKEARGMILQGQSKTVENKTLWTSLIYQVARTRSQLSGM